MKHEKPLWHSIYSDECYTEIVRLVGYGGCLYRELLERLTLLVNRFGKDRVETAMLHLVTYEGQTTGNPKPLAEVRLRDEVRRLAWQLLGPPPEHPEYQHFQDTNPWKPPWDREEAKQEEPPKKGRKKPKAK